MPPHADCDKVHIGACLIIYNKGTWLMIHRIGEHGFNRWSVPGGWMDRGESPEQTIQREVREEIGSGLVVGEPVFLDFTNDVISPEDNHLWHSVTLWYTAPYISGEWENMEPEKVDEIKWLDPYDLPDNQLFGPLKTLIDEGAA